MQIFELDSFPIEQITDLDGLSNDLAAWFVSRDFPVRLFGYSRAFNLQPAIERIRKDQAPRDRIRAALAPLLHEIAAWTKGHVGADPFAALADLSPAAQELLGRAIAQSPTFQQMRALSPNTPPAEARIAWAAFADAIERLIWHLPWMKEMIRFYSAMEEKHVRSAEYLMLTWEPPEVSAGALAATLRHAFRKPVQSRSFLPSVLMGPYEEQSTRLKPLLPGLPWLTILHSYDMQDDWTAATLHPLLNRRYDTAIAIDIITYARNKAQRRAEMSFNAARLVARDGKLLDTRAARVVEDTTYALQELHRQTLHEIQLAIVVSGRSAEELEANAAEIKDLLVPRLRLMRSAGCQGEVLKLFSTLPRTKIEAPWRPRTQLSQAAGCLAGIITFHRPNTNGIFWGIDARRRAPIFVDLFANNQAAHITILGKTGYGKTVFLNVLAERAATVGGMQVIGIDAFENGFRVAAALHGAACYPVSLKETVNILDIAYGQDSKDWLHSQVSHVIGQLSLLMGTPGKSADGKEVFVARVFSTEERGVLDRALLNLYQDKGTTPETPLNGMPILSDLVIQLDELRDPVAAAMSRSLRYLLFGRQDTPDLFDRNAMNIQGRAFNGHTTIDWNFQSDVVYYDFKQVDELYRSFYYLQAIGAIHRYLRLATRDRSRKIFLEIDEFGYASQVDAVARLAVEICKTARKYGCGIVLVDQNPLTFLETESGRQINENAAARVYFHLDDSPAREVGEADSNLTPAQVNWLPRAQPGECLAVIKNDVYQLNIEAHPMELRAFVGS